MDSSTLICSIISFFIVFGLGVLFYRYHKVLLGDLENKLIFRIFKWYMFTALLIAPWFFIFVVVYVYCAN